MLEDRDPRDEDRLDPRDEDRAEDEGLPESSPPLPQKEITGDPQEGLLLPRRDRARAATAFGTTAEEQREGAPLDERLAEEQGDDEPGERQQAGRLVERDSGLTDHEKDEVGEEAAADVGGLTAEEAAVRVEEEAPGAVEEEAPGAVNGGGDRYVDEP